MLEKLLGFLGQIEVLPSTVGECFDELKRAAFEDLIIPSFDLSKGFYEQDFPRIFVGETP